MKHVKNPVETNLNELCNRDLTDFFQFIYFLRGRGAGDQNVSKIISNNPA